VTAEQLKEALKKKLARDTIDKNSLTIPSSSSPEVDAMVNSALIASKKNEVRGIVISNRKYTQIIFFKLYISYGFRPCFSHIKT